MTVLVTGGAGFIGSHVVRRLEAEGENVCVLDNYSRSESREGKSRRDIRFLQDVLDAFNDDIDEVIHLAYINGTKTFYERPYDVMEVALLGILNVLDACKLYDIKKFILVSSSEVCRAQLVDTNEAIPLVIPDPYNPRYSYSAGKIISEMLALHCGLFDRLLIARPFNIYGSGMSPGHVVPDFIAQAKIAPPFTPFKIIGSGDETRSFCYIDDFVDGFMIMRERGEHRGIYNIGTTDEISIRELAREVLHQMNGTPAWIQESGELREGDAPRRRPDISKLSALGYEPKVSLEEGLRRIINEMPSL